MEKRQNAPAVANARGRLAYLRKYIGASPFTKARGRSQPRFLFSQWRQRRLVGAEAIDRYLMQRLAWRHIGAGETGHVGRVGIMLGFQTESGAGAKAALQEIHVPRRARREELKPRLRGPHLQHPAAGRLGRAG